MINDNKTPKGWTTTDLKDIIISEKGKKPKNLSMELHDNVNIPYIDIKAFEKGIISQFTDGENCRLCNKEDILIVWDGARSGLVGMGSRGALGSTLAKITSIFISNHFLFLFLKSRYNYLNTNTKGIGIPHIDPNVLWGLPIPLPPLNEQKRIVAKLEELFSQLDTAVEALKKAKEQIKIYKQSVLSAAFSGKLIEQFRINNSQLTINEETGLPEGWKWVKFIDFCKLQRGYDLPLKNIIKGKYPVVTSGGINGYHNEFKANGPCLLTGRSGGVGNIHYFEVEKYWPHNTVLFVKDFCNNSPKYIYYFFLQFNFKKFSASTAIPTLDRKKLYNELVQLPTLEEQAQIVSEIEKRFSQAENIEKTLDQSLEEAEALRQSILKRAFEGKLVPQDPNDEPASVLLERIMKERESIDKSKLAISNSRKAKKKK